MYSDYNPVNIDTAAPITLTATLAGAPVLGADISVLLCIGVEFFQQIDLVQYILASNNAMMVDKVV
ncbi:MAG: hypothetical protein Q8880_00010 [Bacteroidota bacterium]|nr:hypothetical protein [Bacteroidota bacterium]